MDGDNAVFGYPLGDSTVITEKDIWDAAMAFVQRYGDIDAVIEAGKRADEFGAVGDLVAERTWVRVVHAIGEFLNAEDSGRH